jgi:hypothetical protein
MPQTNLPAGLARLGCFSRWAGVLVFFTSALISSAAEGKSSETTFAEVIGQHFQAWDLNGDGRLEVHEIDRLTYEPSILGDAAAALAALKIHERKLRGAEHRRFAPGLDELQGRIVSGPRPMVPAGPLSNGPTVPYSYEPTFRRLRAKLGAVPSFLFAHDVPDFRVLRQGSIKDCFFFSVIGSIAALRPRRIVSMIEPWAGGGFVVRFPNGPLVRVPPVTQAEALVNNSLSTLADGLWPVVLEKAVGEIYREHTTRDRRTAEPTDSIAHGGSTKRTMWLFTGHASYEFILRRPQYEARDLAEIRQILPQTLEAGRLATASMGRSPAGPKKVPKLGYKHGYGVIGFDRQTDELVLWNPWGNTFTPNGPEGLEHGFITQHGVFRVSLKTFYENFSTLHVESAELLPSCYRKI